MTTKEAIRILDHNTYPEAIAEIEYYAGFDGESAKMAAVLEACNMAIAALRAQRVAESDRLICKAALAKYGPDAQTLMMFEEMSELQKELCKHARGAENVGHIAEEIADVQIMLEQMIILHDCRQNVEEWKLKKLERLEERIGGNDEKTD